ncbi:hypothetical protein N9N16_03360 [Porticoccaceae bacterium]|nr:hypothetical protein [Porticoccaceae bacterium]
MKALSNEELLELTDDFICEWHNMYLHQNKAFRGLVQSSKDDVYWQKKTGKIYVGGFGEIMGCDTFSDAPQTYSDYSIYKPLEDQDLVYCGDWTEFYPRKERLDALKEWTESKSKLLEHPFRKLVLDEPSGHLKRVLTLLNQTGSTSTKFRYQLASKADGQEDAESITERFELAVIMILAAAIHVTGQPENYSNFGVEAEVLQVVAPSADVIKHAAKLCDALVQDGYPEGPRDVMMHNDQGKARLMRELKTLADGKRLTKEVELTENRSKGIVREITMIGKALFNITNNRGASERFSAQAIERILNFLYDMDVINCEAQIGARMISKRQRLLDEFHTRPLSFNQDNLPF